LANGHAGKILGPSQTKRIGTLSLFLLLPALGLLLALIEDAEAVRRHRNRYLKRQDSQVRRSVFTHEPNERVVQRVMRHLVKTCSWQAIIEAVSAERKALADEEAERAAKEAAAASKAAKPKPQPRRSNAAYDRGRPAVMV
jgi:hypothetical protein